MDARDSMTTEIRRIIAENARLSVDISRLSDHDDLFRAGMTSHANVNVMLAIEDRYDVEFPPEMLVRATFASVAAVSQAITTLTTAGVMP